MHVTKFFRTFSSVGKAAIPLIMIAAFGLDKAVAQGDGGLYPRPPANSAFVRLVNAKADETPADGQIGTLGFSSVPHAGGSAYRPIRAGSHKARIGASAATVAFEAGKYYTVAVSGRRGAERANTLVDTTPASKAKAMLSLYNFASQPSTSLALGDGRTVVVGNVGPRRTGSRAVNAATAAFVVTGAGGRPIAKIGNQRIARNVAYSVVVVDGARGPKAGWLVSSMARK